MLDSSARLIDYPPHQDSFRAQVSASHRTCSRCSIQSAPPVEASLFPPSSSSCVSCDPAPLVGQRTAVGELSHDTTEHLRVFLPSSLPPTSQNSPHWPCTVAQTVLISSGCEPQLWTSTRCFHRKKHPATPPPPASLPNRQQRSLGNREPPR